MRSYGQYEGWRTWDVISFGFSCFINIQCNFLCSYSKAENWPDKLIMQLMPKQLIGNIGGQYLKDSKTVVFKPNSCDTLESLIKVMNTGVVRIFAALLRALPLIYKFPHRQDACISQHQRTTSQAVISKFSFSSTPLRRKHSWVSFRIINKALWTVFEKLSNRNKGWANRRPGVICSSKISMFRIWRTLIHNRSKWW